MSKESSAGPYISTKEYASRMIWKNVLEHTILRSEVIDKNGSLKKAREAAEHGETVIVVITHPTRTDPVHEMIAIANMKEFANKQILAPIALHQYKFPWNWLAEETGVLLDPLVTESTLKKKGYENEELGKGEEKFRNDSIDAINVGRPIVIAIQGTRSSLLGEPTKNTLGKLVADVDRDPLAKTKKYSFLFVANEIKGVEDYSQKNGFNFSKKYTVNVGAFLSKEEILARANALKNEAEIVREMKELPELVEYVIKKESDNNETLVSSTEILKRARELKFQAEVRLGENGLPKLVEYVTKKASDNNETSIEDTEILKRARELGRELRKKPPVYAFLDQVAFNELKKISPRAYLHKLFFGSEDYDHRN